MRIESLTAVVIISWIGSLFAQIDEMNLSE